MGLFRCDRFLETVEEKMIIEIEQGVAPLRATSGARVNADVGAKEN